MNAELRRLHSPDVYNLSEFVPESDSFCIFVQMIVGPKDMDGEESFDITICTPQWILKALKSDDVMTGHARLIVLEYNYDRIFDFLKRYCERIAGSNWNEIAHKLERLGRWEFEDYQEYKERGQ